MACGSKRDGQSSRPAANIRHPGGYLTVHELENVIVSDPPATLGVVDLS